MKKGPFAVLLLVFILLSQRGAGAQDATLQAAGDPELPRVFLDTSYTPPSGGTINVPAGGDLQAAINAASPGDTIVLQAGATYTTPPNGFILPNKGGSSWIVIRTSNIQALPEGTRVGPSNAPAMAKIVTTGVWPAIQTVPSSHHYRLIGIEFALDPNLRSNYGIITVGDGSRAQTSLATVAHDIIIDRCYIHGNPNAELSRGVALNSARTSVIDSYISDCHGLGFDTQAIAGWNGPGPFKIVNNYLEGAAENVLFGGADPAIQGLVPSDIEFRRNHCFKPLSWKADDPSYAGSPWSIKNIFELKNAQRILMDGNTFENNWVSGQSGPAIVFTVRNQEGTAPWSVVQDITFTNNVLKHSAAGIVITASDSNGTSQQTSRVKIENNLFDDIGAARWGGGGRWLQILDGVANVSVDHNTVLNTSHIVMSEGRVSTSFVYRNNLSRHNEYGIVGTGTAPGNSTLNTYFPGAIFLKNVLSGGPSQAYPTDNFFPATLDAVGFVNAAAGNYRLASNSPYKRAGTDGKDIGADIDAIEAAMGGGSPAPPPPPPPSASMSISLVRGRSDSETGGWAVVSDSSAAGGSRIHNADAGAPKLPAPLASPSHFFEMTFNADAGRPYRLWIRARAQNDFYGNDSIFIQFSGSVNASGSPLYRIGTTSATDINLEDCSGCGLSGWGWQDNGWGIGVMGPVIYFQTTGLQTIRVQPREDGLSIDQIVLSPGAYLSASPGATKNDNTILPKSGGTQPPPVNLPPLVSLTASTTSGVGPLSVQFTGIASDADGTIASYRWDFGNGQTSTAQSPAHTYQSTGSYTARFTATDNSGASSSASVVITVTAPTPPPAVQNVVLYAAEAPIKQGGWAVVADSSAAGGSRLHLPDAGTPKLGAPLASPSKYFEMTFNAEAGRPYRLWIRGKAQSDHWGNDSIWVQFSGSVTSTGGAIYRIGSTSGADINLEDCSGCGLQGWGWQDNGWGVGVMGPVIYFAVTGPQTIRVQNREDGLSIDQIVLSASDFTSTRRPGALKNDATILPKQ